MRALVQRVTQASVTVAGEVVGHINAGLLVFLGVRHEDTDLDAEKLAHKVTHLRVFKDDAGKMNLSVLEAGGQLLVVSQFTLYADTAKGNRPSYIAAAKPEPAEVLYQRFVSYCKTHGVIVSTGIFQADMQVNIVNDGPVTLMCQSES